MKTKPRFPLEDDIFCTTGGTSLTIETQNNQSIDIDSIQRDRESDDDDDDDC